jgi:DNA-binding MarR family transcriptional regulator
MATQREKVKNALARAKVRDASGYAVAKLSRKTGINAGSLSSLLTRMEADGEITRDTRNRRTFEISLSPTTNGAAPEAVAGEAVDEKLVQLGAAVVARITHLAQENAELLVKVADLETELASKVADIRKLKRDLDGKQLETSKLERQLGVAEAEAAKPKLGTAAQAALDVLMREMGGQGQ